MLLIRLEAAVILGIVLPQIFGNSTSSPLSDRLAAVDICMSAICKPEQAFHERICEGCRISGSEVCNMTVQTVLDQFPSLHGCVCAWEEELCDSVQVLATQCHRKPAAQQKRSTVMDWQTSTLINYVYNGSGSCTDTVRVCVSDAVCNRFLAPVLQVCTAEQCDPELCQQVTRHFYASMPRNVADMLGLCECEASDESCLHMKTALHSGTCGGETRICQDTVHRCVEDSNCRDLLRTLRTKCWHSEDAQCSDSDLQHDECFTRMDPALILGADSECKVAIMSTLGTTLHHPCTCRGVHLEDLPICTMIHNVLHNRTRFMMKSSTGTSEVNESDQGLAQSRDYPLYAFATAFFVGIVIVMPVAVVSAAWLLRRRDKTKYHHPQKSTCS